MLKVTGGIQEPLRHFKIKNIYSKKKKKKFKVKSFEEQKAKKLRSGNSVIPFRCVPYASPSKKVLT